MAKRAVITMTSDFGVQSQGVGIMEAVALDINSEARVVHLMHGLPSFELRYAARTLETIKSMQKGFHVCVVDPGVGTSRKPIIIETKRGDFLIGPDNGVLISGANFLGGIKKVVEITNKKYMRKPVSPTFHGRDIFSPAAAYLSKGVKIEGFGKEVPKQNLVKPPYGEASRDGNEMLCEVISVNKFGSLHLNLTHEEFDKLGFSIGDSVKMRVKNIKMEIVYSQTFGDVAPGEPLLFKDDYGRMEIALNQESFSRGYGINIGDDISIYLP